MNNTKITKEALEALVKDLEWDLDLEDYGTLDCAARQEVLTPLIIALLDDVGLEVEG